MAITANQKVLTLDYWKRADQLVPGDIVFDRTGAPVEVKLVTTYRSQDCYEIEFNDFLTFSGDAKTIMPVESGAYRIMERIFKGTRKSKASLKTIPLGQMASEPLFRKGYGYSRYSVQTTPPIQLPHQDLPVPPFIFGYWMANRKAGGHLTATKQYKETIYQTFSNMGYQIKESWAGFTTTPKIKVQLAPNIPTSIPNNYLMGSAEQRIELLRGFIHGKSRQYSKKLDTFRISTRNYLVFKQLQWLAESLGHRTSLETQPCNNLYVVKFQSKLKLAEDQKEKQIKWAHARRFIRKINKIEPQLCVYIETKGSDNTILVGEGFIACR